MNYLVLIMLDYHTLLYIYQTKNIEQVNNIIDKYKNYDIKIINVRMNKNSKIYDFVKE